MKVKCLCMYPDTLSKVIDQQITHTRETDSYGRLEQIESCEEISVKFLSILVQNLMEYCCLIVCFIMRGESVFEMGFTNSKIMT